MPNAYLIQRISDGAFYKPYYNEFYVYAEWTLDRDRAEKRSADRAFETCMLFSQGGILCNMVPK